MTIGIVNYGVGNIASVSAAVTAVGSTPELLREPSESSGVDALILPGVGSFAKCMQILDETGWSARLRSEVLGSGTPILGICLGMQLLASLGSEGAESEDVAGLGLIEGRVGHLNEIGCNARVPHVGWNDIKVQASAGGLFSGIPDGTDFYFVHSYVFTPTNREHVAATCEYGVEVTAAVQHGPVAGVQFHPEKSSRAGFRLLKNFIEQSLC